MGKTGPNLPFDFARSVGFFPPSLAPGPFAKTNPRITSSAEDPRSVSLP